MVFTISKDTFIESLGTSIQKLSTSVSPEYLYVRTGHGARFTLAMNVKTGKEIGHPSSEYIWDIPSVVDHCFSDAGITATLYVTTAFSTLARKTQAQADRTFPASVSILEEDELLEITGNLIYPLPTGNWVSDDDMKSIAAKENNYPFGPMALEISDFEQQFSFPWATLGYLADTLERGEEPMEVEGHGHYSAVSGWKAFARWMQSFAVPLPDIQHSFLSNYPILLFERRQGFANYWQSSLDQYSGQELQLAKDLQKSYASSAKTILQYQQQPIKINQVREIYFTEQKTQPIYKRISNYLANHSEE